jgi:hypothetical protein
MARLAAGAAFVAAVAISAAIGLAQAANDVTGTWLFSVQTRAGQFAPVVTLKQKGGTLTGHQSSQTFGEADFKGSVDGGHVEMVVNTYVEGAAIAISYTGTIENEGAMGGDVDLAWLGAGTWTARRR